MTIEPEERRRRRGGILAALLAAAIGAWLVYLWLNGSESAGAESTLVAISATRLARQLPD